MLNMLKKVSVLGGKFCHHNMTSPHISPPLPAPHPSRHPSHSQSQWPHMHNPPIIMLCQIHNLPYHPHLHGSHVSTFHGMPCHKHLNIGSSSHLSLCFITPFAAMFCCFKFLCFFCLVEPFIVQVVG